MDPEYGSGLQIRITDQDYRSVLGSRDYESGLTLIEHILMRTIFHATKSRIKILHHDFDSIFSNPGHDESTVREF